jgi:hypothetical protein
MLCKTVAPFVRNSSFRISLCRYITELPKLSKLVGVPMAHYNNNISSKYKINNLLYSELGITDYLLQNYQLNDIKDININDAEIKKLYNVLTLGQIKINYDTMCRIFNNEDLIKKYYYMFMFCSDLTKDEIKRIKLNMLCTLNIASNITNKNNLETIVGEKIVNRIKSIGNCNLELLNDVHFFSSDLKYFADYCLPNLIGYIGYTTDATFHSESSDFNILTLDCPLSRTYVRTTIRNYKSTYSQSIPDNSIIKIEMHLITDYCREFFPTIKNNKKILLFKIFQMNKS